MGTGCVSGSPQGCELNCMHIAQLYQGSKGWPRDTPIANPFRTRCWTSGWQRTCLCCAGPRQQPEASDLPQGPQPITAPSGFAAGQANPVPPPPCTPRYPSSLSHWVDHLTPDLCRGGIMASCLAVQLSDLHSLEASGPWPKLCSI